MGAVQAHRQIHFFSSSQFLCPGSGTAADNSNHRPKAAYLREVFMRKNRFCTFTLISALMIAALPSSLAIAGNEPVMASASAQSLPKQQAATLTVTPSGSSEGYKADGSKFTPYRVMSLTQTDGTDWTWKMVNGFVYPGTESFEPDDLATYPAARMQNLADRLALQVETTMTDKLEEKAISGGSCSWSTENLGIYLVVETETAAGNFPSAPFLVSLPFTDEDKSTWNYNAVAHPKGSEVGIEKLIHNAKGSYINTQTYDGDADTVGIGDEVDYKITTQIPNYTAVYFENGKNPTFQITDTIAKGLTLKADSVRLDLGSYQLKSGKDFDYTQTIQTKENGTTVLTIDLAASYLSVSENQNKDLVLSYQMTVNEDVSLADNGNVNTVVLTYSYDPADPEREKEIEDKATVYSFGIQIEKYDGDSVGESKTKLAGAQFALFKEKTAGGSVSDALNQDPCRPVGVTDENGVLDFKGLDAGTYYLKEVKAPADYSLLTKPIKVQIIPTTADDESPEIIVDGQYSAYVNGNKAGTVTTEGVSRILAADNREETVIVAAANHKGFSLPMTGGRGIALILIVAFSGMMAVTVFFLRGENRKAASEKSHKV